MPLHRHECEKCGHQFRVLVLHGTENDRPTCPECGSIESRRLMPLVAVHFKGSGYYKTDHGRKGGVRSDRGSETTSSDSGETKSSDGSNDSSEKKSSSDAKAGGDKSSDSASSTKTPSSE